MGPLLAAAGGGLLQGTLGFFAARAKKKQLEKMEEANMRRNVLDQAWAGTYGQKARLPEMMEKPSPVLAALQGGMSGAMQGMNVYQGMQSAGMNKSILDKLQGQQDVSSSLNKIGLGTAEDIGGGASLSSGLLEQQLTPEQKTYLKNYISQIA